MTEREKMLTKENKILIDLVKVCAQLMHAKEDIQAERKRLFNSEIEKCKSVIPERPIPNWRYGDICLCSGKSFTSAGLCKCCGKRVAV